MSQRAILLRVWMLVTFIEQRERSEEMKFKKAINYCKYFILLSRIQEGCVNFFCPAVIHRWAWSGYFP